jgi:hypothetical protein
MMPQTPQERAILHETMVVVRGCSGEEDERGLCECARFIWFLIREGRERERLLKAALEGSASDGAQ